MTTQSILDKLKDDFEVIITSKLALLNVANFDKYIADTPDNAETKQLAFYFDRKERDSQTYNFNVIIQAQLCKVSTRDSWDYQDSIEDAILNYDVANIEMHSFERLAIENYPVFENDSTIIIFELQFSKFIDDCNYGD